MTARPQIADSPSDEQNELRQLALGPANWQIRPMISWKTEHFLSYFCRELIVCGAWPRP